MISKRTKAIVAYVVARFQEPSTIRGVILLLTILGAKINPEIQTEVIELGLFLTGLFAVMLPDKFKDVPKNGSDDR